MIADYTRAMRIHREGQHAMKTLRYSLVCVLCLFVFPLLSSAAEEAVSESALEQNAKDSLMLRSPAEISSYQILAVAGQNIPATFIDDKLGENYGGVIFLHDADSNMDTAGIMSTLRQQLPESGWATMTMELSYPYQENIMLSPTLDTESETDTTNDEATESSNAEVASDTSSEPEPDPNTLPPVSNQQRLEAALAFFTAKNIRTVILLGHGQGGTMAIELLNKVTTPVNGLILLATPAINADDSFSPFELPILDVVGTRDIDVIAASKHRKLLMKRSENLQYSMRSITGADSHFIGFGQSVNNMVRAWLKTVYVDPLKDTQ